MHSENFLLRHAVVRREMKRLSLRHLMTDRMGYIGYLSSRMAYGALGVFRCGRTKALDE